MRILLVGLAYRGYTQTFATALRSLGHDVDSYIGARQFDLATRLRRVAQVRIPNLLGARRDYLHSERQRFRSFVRGSAGGYDLALFANAERLATDEALSELAPKAGLSGVWLLDDVEAAATSNLDFRSFDRLASFNERQAADISAELARTVDFVPQGFAPVVPDARAPWSERPLFIGAPYPSRREAAAAVRALGVPIEVVGRMWPRWVDAADDLQLTGDVSLERSIAMSERGRICVNGHRAPDTGVSPRVFEIGGAGGLIVTDNVHAPQFFDPGSEMLHWNDPAEAADHVARAVREPLRAAEMSRRARARVLAEHTIAHRLVALLDGWGLT